MRCRHTVPDWHRYVAAGEDIRPIFAACRLLVKEGERATDPRAIACAYWGHQRQCPLYDGPELTRSAQPRPTSPPSGATGDMPVARETPWPVRRPGAADIERVLLIVLTGVSVVLLTWAAVLTLAALQGGSVRVDHLVVVLLAGSVSFVTLLLTLIRLWVKR